MPSIAFRLGIVLACAAALGLAGCGRKGKLEPPPEQHLVQTPATTTPDGRQTQPKTVDPGPEKPKRHLFLDPLLN